MKKLFIIFLVLVNFLFSIYAEQVSIKGRVLRERAERTERYNVLTQGQKDFIKYEFEHTNAAYEDMVSKGFKLSMIDDCNSIDELYAVFDEYIRDDHFECTISYPHSSGKWFNNVDYKSIHMYKKNISYF